MCIDCAHLPCGIQTATVGDLEKTSVRSDKRTSSYKPAQKLVLVLRQMQSVFRVQRRERSLLLWEIFSLGLLGFYG